MQWGDEENIPFLGWGDMSVKIERDKKMTEVNVPFLVNTQKLNDTILGFNAIKHLVQNRNDTVYFKQYLMKLVEIRWEHLLN